MTISCLIRIRMKSQSTKLFLPSNFETLVAFLSDIFGAINGRIKSVKATADSELRPDEIVLE